MLQQDEIEKFELLRDIAEHNAMFENSDGVRQVREARETAITIPDEDFEETVKELFGRDLKLDDKDKEDVERNIPRSSLDIYDDFDEVEFVPFGG